MTTGRPGGQRQPGGEPHVGVGEAGVHVLEEPGEHRVLHVAHLLLRRALVLVPGVAIGHVARGEALDAVQRHGVGVAHGDVLAVVAPVERGPARGVVGLQAGRLEQQARRERDHGEQQQHAQRRPEDAAPDQRVPPERTAHQPARRKRRAARSRSGRPARRSPAPSGPTGRARPAGSGTRCRRHPRRRASSSFPSSCPRRHRCHRPGCWWPWWTARRSPTRRRCWRTPRCPSARRARTRPGRRP